MAVWKPRLGGTQFAEDIGFGGLGSVTRFLLSFFVTWWRADGVGSWSVMLLLCGGWRRFQALQVPPVFGQWQEENPLGANRMLC